ncbi:hypothetical protein [Methanoplanus endosymbiosus]|uniref:Uncharacterized protein n=1 Tax=Methanoplanus endosymbiosus TaxID=33865 RepID=A0A9E7THZ7_9EURY|nr:hypothetical protein [Methanoplanus endosymbiosus]UUX91618.1 hypothetical protein L6E24_09570 [Methanoplanus endosymbiosus]
MKTINQLHNILDKIEASSQDQFTQTVFIIDDITTPEQQAHIDQAHAAGKSVIILPSNGRNTTGAHTRG